MPKLIDISGKTYDRLTVIRKVQNKNQKHNTHWLCRCTCGKETVVSKPNLTSGHTKSCGCLNKDIITKHGKYKTAEYKTWCAIHSRCKNHKLKGYKNYGGRGISVCERWGSFENFLSDMGKRPSSKHSIERVDVNGNYEPSNCKWATTKEQSINTRIRIDNTTGYRGIYKRSENGKWRAYISLNGKSIYLGQHQNKEKAMEERKRAEQKYWGKNSLEYQIKALSNESVFFNAKEGE